MDSWKQQPKTKLFFLLFLLFSGTFTFSLEITNFPTLDRIYLHQHVQWTGDTLWASSNYGLFWYDTLHDTLGRMSVPDVAYSSVADVWQNSKGDLYTMSFFFHAQSAQLQKFANGVWDAGVQLPYVLGIDRFKIDVADHFWYSANGVLTGCDSSWNCHKFSIDGMNITEIYSDPDTAGIWAASATLGLFCFYSLPGDSVCYKHQDLTLPYGFGKTSGGDLYILDGGSEIFKLPSGSDSLRLIQYVGNAAGYGVANCMTMASDSEIIIGNYQGEVLSLKSETTLTKLYQLDTAISSLFYDDYDRLWVLSGGKFYVEDGDSLKLKKEFENAVLNRKAEMNIANDKNGVVWSNSAYFDGKQWHQLENVQGLTFVKPDGEILFSYKPEFGSPAYKRFDPEQNKIENSDFALQNFSMIGAKTSLAYNSSAGGTTPCYIDSGNGWENMTSFPGSLECDDFFPMVRMPNGKYAAHTITDSGTVYYYEENQGWNSFHLNLEFARAKLGAIDRSGRVWFTINDTLFYYDGIVSNRVAFAPPNWAVDNNLLHEKIYSVVQDLEGTIWVSHYYGLYYFENETWNHVDFKNGAGIYKSRLSVDEHGDVWGGFASYYYVFRIKRRSSDAFYDTLSLPENYPFVGETSTRVDPGIVKPALQSRAIQGDYEIEYWHLPDGRKSRNPGRYMPKYPQKSKHGNGNQ